MRAADKAKTFTADQIAEARLGEERDGLFVSSGIVIRCSRCGDEVDLMVSELEVRNESGRLPKGYLCAECA